MPFKFQKLAIPEVILIKALTLNDERGFFRETFRKSVFAQNGIAEDFVQDNYSCSLQGVLRGLHFQISPRAQGKILIAVKGTIFDVAVDLRQGARTYRKWVGVNLSYENGDMLYVPPGFAHGFCVLSPEAHVLYKVTAEYAPESEQGIAWNDPEVGVRWPIANPILSERDSQLPRLSQFAYSPFTFDRNIRSEPTGR